MGAVFKVLNVGRVLPWLFAHAQTKYRAVQQIGFACRERIIFSINKGIFWGIN